MKRLDIMKHRLVLISFISFFVTAQISYAMEVEEQKPNTFTRITCVESPNGVKFLSKHCVAISGYSGCSIFDLKIQKPISLSNFDCSYLAVSPDRKKVAFSYDKTIELYDVASKTQEWKKEEQFTIGSFEFNPCGKAIIACLHEDARGHHRIVSRNLIGSSNDDNDGFANSEGIQIALHPKKEMMCVAEMWGTAWLCLSLDLQSPPVEIGLSHHNGSCQIGGNDYVAIVDSEGKVISIVDTNNKNSIWELKAAEDEIFINMVFYPKGSVLAVSSAKMRVQGSDTEESEEENLNTQFNDQYIMRYWDVENKKLLGQMQLDRSWDYGFAFDPTGRTVAIIFNEGCELYSVQNNVRYAKHGECEYEIEKQFSYYLFLIKEYLSGVQSSLTDQLIPKDIVSLVFKTLVKTFKRK